MAKSKAKAKKSTLCKNICLLIALAFALTALCMTFVEMVVAIDGSASYKGHEVVFGYNKVVSFLPLFNTVTLEAVWAFSFANFMTYFSVILAVICCVGAIAYKKQGLVLAVLTMLLFLSAGMGFLNQAGNLEPYTIAIREYYEGIYQGDANMIEKVNEKVNEIIINARNNHQISWGAYIGAISCFVAGACALLSKILWQVHANKEKE